MEKKRFWLIVSLIFGSALFFYFLVNFGLTSAQLISQNFNPLYLSLYIFFTLFAFFPLTWRFQAILIGYDKKLSFWALLRQTISAYSLSYITPTVRLGGEPLRAYMLKKECDVDLKTGSSAIILDKFVEFAGSATFGIVGLIAILFIPGFPYALKVAFISLLVLAIIITVGFYIRTVNGKGSLSTIFQLARLHKIRNWHTFTQTIQDVEKMVGEFFRNHKKALFFSSFFYGISCVIFFLEFKFLLLSFGVDASILDLLLAINILGLVNFVPVPAGLGFLEAGQSTLFAALKGDGNIGFATALLIRARALFVVGLGFLLITHFSGRQVIKEYKERAKEQNI